MKDFKNEEVWRKGHELAMTINRVTDLFPFEQVDILGEGLKSAALQMEYWIDQGLTSTDSRRRKPRLGIACAKLANIKSLVISCNDQEWMTSADFRDLKSRITNLRKIIGQLTGLREDDRWKKWSLAL